MKKFSVINYKGGTGKTCTTVNLGHGLALRGKKVLIIDTDPQGSAGYHLGIEAKKNLYHLLIENASFNECVVKARKNLDIICSNEHLFPASIAMSNMKKREFLLDERLKKLQDYDYVLLDCAPSMNVLNQNALIYTKNLILPVSMEYLSLIGVKQLLKNIKIINKLFNKNIIISKVVPTFYDPKNKKSLDILNSLKRVFPGLISSEVHNCSALSDASGFKNTVFEYDLNSVGAEDYFKLVDEVINIG